MKKALASLLAILLLSSCLFSCSKAPKINKESWALVSVAKNEDVIYVASRYADKAPGVPTLDCSLSAKRGDLTLAELAGGKTYTGTYGDRDVMGISADYTVTFGKTNGQALVAFSENEAGDLLTVLTLYLGDYTILFEAE